MEHDRSTVTPTPVSEHQKRYWKYEYDVTARSMLPLLSRWGVGIRSSSVIDIGCGEGGGLCAFFDAGATCAGFDIDRMRIGAALTLKGDRPIRFEQGDLYRGLPLLSGERYDILYMHDVYEHLERKDEILARIQEYMKPDARLIITFPPYFSAYGAHQQLLKSPVARIPFFHLLPFGLSGILPRLKGESTAFVEEVRKLGRLKMGMRGFEKIVSRSSLEILHCQGYLISPNHIRFGLPPLEAGFLQSVTGLREVLCTGVVYLLGKQGTER
jgi:SAM-dependent methyltransferase